MKNDSRSRLFKGILDRLDIEWKEILLVLHHVLSDIAINLKKNFKILKNA